MTLAPAFLYTGRTVHERKAPLHRFSYRIALMLIDLDRLDEAGSLSRLFSVERFNLFSLREKDHGPRDGSPLSVWAHARFAEAGIETAGARITLLCSPRVMGFVFNPISIYFAQKGERLLGVIYQVHNTFGDAHAYVVPAGNGPRQHQSADKVFYVSPFFDVAGRYDFVLHQPGERFKLIIRKVREDGADFLATMALKRSAMTSGSLARLFASQPFSTLKTVAAIHFEALRLWMKGARYRSRPEPPGNATHGRLIDAAKRETFSARRVEPKLP